MPSGRTPRSGFMGLHIVTSTSNAVQSTHPGNALCIERGVGNVAKTITSRQYVGPHRGSR